jgi:hypothetical protein
MGTPISAWLMQYDYWLPYILGTVIMIIGSTPLLFLPETLQEAKANKARYRREASPDATEASDNSDGRIDPTGKRPMLQDVIRQAREFKDATKFIWRDYSVCIMVLSCLVSLVSRQSSTVFLQYVSKKFNWSIARVCTSRVPTHVGPCSSYYRPAF